MLRDLMHDSGNGVRQVLSGSIVAKYRIHTVSSQSTIIVVQCKVYSLLPKVAKMWFGGIPIKKTGLT